MRIAYQWQSLTVTTMKNNLEFLAQLNIIAIVSRAIRIIDKCYKDECENRNLEKACDLFDYTPFPEEFNYAEFYSIVELKQVASPLWVADMISAYYMDSAYDNTYLLKLLTEKLDLEFDTDNEYQYYRRFVDDHDFNMPGTFDVECFIKHMPILRKRIELTFGVDIYAKKGVAKSMSNNLINTAYLRKVYNFVNGDAFTNISFDEFNRCVAERDFSRMYHSDNALYSRIKCHIFAISRIAGIDWYRDAAHSINTEPQKCSGASVPKLWRKELLAIRL